MEQALNRVIQESVPGKQVTIAHVIASPAPELYERLGMDPAGSIGILTITPCEAAIIAADAAAKTAMVEIVFLDRFTGSEVVGGDVQSVQTALRSVCGILREKLCFTVVDVTLS